MSSFRSRRRRAGFEPIHRWAECELPQTGANFALRVDLLLDHRLGCLRDGYGISVSVHYLPGAVFGSEDHRNPQIAWGTPCDLRVTMVLGPEDGTWKVVHRHANPITIPQAAESVIQE